jgi:hypothetical protein
MGEETPSALQAPPPFSITKMGEEVRGDGGIRIDIGRLFRYGTASDADGNGCAQRNSHRHNHLVSADGDTDGFSQTASQPYAG